MKLTVNERIASMRKWMHRQGIQAVIVPSADPHLSEYLPDYWKTREWISGFSGSAGTIIVGIDTVGLWTDSRYFIQAEKELKDTVVHLNKFGEQGVLSPEEWLVENFFEGDKVFIDGSCITLATYRRYEKKLKTAGIEMVAGSDMFGEIWEERPVLPANPVFRHTEKFVGSNLREKLSSIRGKMKKSGATHLLVTALDEIAWALNLRGNDVECNPVFLAWLLIGMEESFLFADSGKFSEEIIELLKREKVTLRPYEEVEIHLQELGLDSSLMIDPDQVNYSLAQSAQSGRIIERFSPVCELKAQKTEAEVANVRNAMKRDGVAVFRAFEWLKIELENRPVAEYELAEKLAEFRSLQQNYTGESFHAIVGYKENGAIVHYRATEQECSMIENNGMLLIDSGGQYLDGTTDITRTLHLSEPSGEEKKHFTLVLKGMIGLSQAVFPEGTMGVQLDVLARMHLWQQGLNYGHGTGHGVGYFMNVHEPPQGFVPNLSQRGKSILKQGMITSNEPGYYLEGSYGIRCENLVVCQKREDGYLFLETLTLMPFDKKLIDVALMDKQELEWINNYHQKVYRELAPLLEENELTLLKEQCSPI